MLSSLRAAAFTLLGSLALVSAARASDGWIADFDEAVKVAKAEKKDLFVDFTGSDWCGWCKKLDAEVFSHEEFLSEIKKSFVLVALDFPKADEVKAKVPNPKRNEELSAKYGVEGFPTILLLDIEGEVLGQTGYQKGGAAAYLAHVNGLYSSGKKQLAEAQLLHEAWKSASGDAKDVAWDKLAEAFEKMEKEHVGKRKLVEPLKAALEFDKDNAKGRKRRAVSALIAHGAIDATIFAAALEVDPKNEGGLPETALEALFEGVQNDDMAKAALKALDEFDPRNAWQKKEANFRLHAIAAFWCSEFIKDLERAKKYATAAKAIGGDDEQANAMLDGILAR